MVVKQDKKIKQKQERLTGMCFALFHCAIIFTGKPYIYIQHGKGLKNTTHTWH